MVAQPDMSYLAYQGNVVTPFQRATEAYEAAQKRNAAEEAAEAAAKEAAETKQKTEAMGLEMATLIEEDRITPENINKIRLKYPELSEHYNEVYGDISEEEKYNRGIRALTLSTAITSGQKDAARTNLEDYIAAATERGETEEVKQAELMLGLLDAGATNQLELAAELFASWAMGEEGYTSAKSTLQDEGRKEEIQGLAMRKTFTEIGLAEAQIAQIEDAIAGRDTTDLTAEDKHIIGYQALMAAGDFDLAQMYARDAGMLPSESITTEDKYVADLIKAWLQNPDNAGKTEDDIPGGMLAEWRLQHKRAQEGEVYSNELATQQAKFEFSERISYAARYGERMAEISTAAEKRIAEGELSAAETMENAKYAMETLVGGIAQKYFNLNEMNAIINIEDTSLENAFTAMQSSEVGQWLGRKLGTTAQAERDFILSNQGAILNEIKQAKNISARGLDSEKELEFYSRILSDPKKNIQTNMAILALLSDTYGDGSVATELRANPDEGLTQLINTLEEEHAAMYAEPEEDNTRTPAEIPTVTTQAEIDALPQGAYFYIIQDGKQMKVRKN